jgi:hypothetical protein
VLTRATCENAWGKFPTWRRARVVLLGQQAHVVPQGEQPLEQTPGVLVPPLQDVVVRQPEAAGKESALVAGETIHGAPGVVPRDEAVLEQKLLHCRDRADYAGVLGRQESN